MRTLTLDSRTQGDDSSTLQLPTIDQLSLDKVAEPGMVGRFDGSGAITTSTGSTYMRWLQQQGTRIYKSENAYWHLYKGALIPVKVGPAFIDVTNDEAFKLLNDSGALFLRYCSDSSLKELPWWYIVCDSYDRKNLSSKARNQIAKGRRNCSVERINAEWLAAHGYECYVAAYQRYKNARPANENVFRRNLLGTIGGPFEYWGVFAKGHLAGYCQGLIEGNHVTTNVIKLDPAYLAFYVSYALVTSLIEHYVVRNGFIINNGSRSVVHDTNFQDLLLKLGFRKQFCRLNIIYRSSLGLLVKMLYPFWSVMNLSPDTNRMYKLRALLFQEHLRRLCIDR
jgi:hypothetical protein